MVQNKGLIYKAHPTAKPEPGKHIAVETRDFDLDQAPPPGGFTAKVHYVSFDPYQRGRMREPTKSSYFAPFELGQPVGNTAIVTIIKADNNNPKATSSTQNFQPGDLVLARMCGTEEYAVIGADAAASSYKLDNPYNLDPVLFLGALGMPGLTAYSSLYEIGEPKKGQTIFISAASGAVGQLVGQLAKHEGMRVIGSVGDDKKLDFILNDLGFDAGFNYKNEKPEEALTRLAPEGLDIYYENVGGEHLDAALAHMNNFGRIVACGMISQYNLPKEEIFGIKNIREVVGKRLKMQGFIVSDENMGPKHMQQHQEKVQKWIHDGTFKATLSITHGIDNAAEGLVGIFDGKNFGKAVLEVSKLG